MLRNPAILAAVLLAVVVVLMALVHVAPSYAAYIEAIAWWLFWCIVGACAVLPRRITGWR